MITTLNDHLLQQGLLERADARFVWNGELLRNFNGTEMRKFQLPLIMGCKFNRHFYVLIYFCKHFLLVVTINQVQINGQTFFWSLISRRSIQRAGTRLFCRGINVEGHVANYVETEQIVEFNGQCISFVQTRGSMPFYWRQLPNLRYKPKPQLIQGKDHLTASQKHFEAQIGLYGRQVVVNLVKYSEVFLKFLFLQIICF